MSDFHQASISQWLRNLEENDSDAAEHLWSHYFEKLVRQARTRLQNYPNAMTGSEDIAASVFESLWRGAQAGRFNSVQNRKELWWLLLALTQRKVASHVRRELAKKRGGNIQPRSLDNDLSQNHMAQNITCDDPRPEDLLVFEEEYARLLTLLRDDLLRKIAVHKIEGHTNQMISEDLGIAPATVTRKIRLIRDTWQRELGQ